MEFEIRENVSRPERKSNAKFHFGNIPVNGALYVYPAETETLKQVTDRTRNAVASFKKSHTDYKGLKVFVEKKENRVMVYRYPNDEE